MSCHISFKRLFQPAMVAGLLLLGSASGLRGQSRELVVYAYDSFVAEWGPAPKVVPLFEKEYNCKVTLVSKGDAGQVLSAAVLEKSAPKADILLGLDNHLVRKAIQANVLEAYRPKNMDGIPASLDFDPTHHLTPFDYGYFCLIWDSQKLANPPKTLADLTKPEYARKLILMDPRTSTPGLGFLANVVAMKGDKWPEFWKALKPSILTVTSGWDAGYGMFTQGEAPLVVSYSTSPAYHVQNDKTDRYKAIVFPEGLVMQVEGAGMVKSARHADLAKAFLEFMLTPKFQKELPFTQWMYPVNPTITLPASYHAAPTPSKVLKVEPALLEKALAKWADVAAK
ncbi:MAG TPA: thiamine ABC transporter substrate-binding protein [Holophaga sp.]|nr:thiamine ABC transporter substrate-binding protein [Holophaga sp.]